jgi:DNA gyrase inhibitor GyrI
MKWTTLAALATLAMTSLITLGCQVLNVKSAYDNTPSKSFEIKTIPESKVLVTEAEGYYFDQSNRLFRKLFNYIKKNDVAMTVPVEARIDDANMVFYVGPGDDQKNLESAGDVKVALVPERTVASLGMKGSYSAKNFKKAKARLEEWLEGQNKYIVKGEAYAVFWDGPYVPGFMKRFEVHVPVEKKIDSSSDGAMIEEPSVAGR